MKKTYRCTVNLSDFEKTETGKPKIWRTDGVKTFCCDTTPAYFIWEKASRFNSYEPYSGYVNCRYVKILD